MDRTSNKENPEQASSAARESGKNHIIKLLDQGQTREVKRPSYQVYDSEEGIYSAGVWHHYTVKNRGEVVAADAWLASPIHVEAVTRDQNRENYGRLLKFRNTDGEWRSWAMPADLLAGRGDELWKTLLSMGVDINRKELSRLADYFLFTKPKERLLAVSSTGWHGDQLFILPRRNIGDEPAIYQSEHYQRDDYESLGPLEGWQESLGRYCADNPILMLSVCWALAGPLLKHLGRDGGGFHLVGDSSTGKSTAVFVGASVWGDYERYRRTWNATANGLESVAAQRNDTLLVLDEIGQANPKAISSIVYSLANGVGRARANRTGHSRAAKQWRIAVLSSGEKELSDYMAEGGQNVMAGHLVRLLDVSANRAYGAWDHLHGCKTGAELSNHLQRAAREHYGVAGPTFIERLIDSGLLSGIQDELATLSEEFCRVGGQQQRGSEKFCIAALAGELAITLDILPCPPGSATSAMHSLNTEWLAQKGAQPAEDQLILSRIADFLAQHSDSRFSSLFSDDRSVRDRAGYWRQEVDGRVYLFSSSALQEAAGSFPLRRILVALDRAGALAQEELTRGKQVKLQTGENRRLYHIKANRLDL